MAMTLTDGVRQTTIGWVRENAKHLMQMHWEEVGDENLPPNPLWVMFEAMEEAGTLVTLSAHDGEDVAGYAVASITRCPLSQGKTIGRIEAMFVREESRSRGFGLGMYRRAVSEAAKRGAVKMYAHAPHGSRMAKVMARLLGDPRELVFKQELGR